MCNHKNIFKVVLMLMVCIYSYFLDPIVDVDVFILHFYPPFTYLLAVNPTYNTGKSNHHSLVSYQWNLNTTSCLELENIKSFTTTFPLKNFSFECIGKFHYDVWVYNSISRAHKEGGYYLSISSILMLLHNYVRSYYILYI